MAGSSDVEGSSDVAGRRLRVAALVKQIPVAEEMSLGPDRRLVRDGVALELNAFCRRAVSKGVELARDSGGTCTVFTLGPPSAEDVLREAVAWGADEGVHLCDPAFAGSDTLATARALAAALRLTGPFDLVLTGRNSLDGETGQVGPEVAQLLDLPFAAAVRRLDAAKTGTTLRLELELDDGSAEVEVDLPAVLSVAERLCDPCKVDPPGRAAVAPGRLRRVSASELGPGPWGAVGSPTRVGATRLLTHERRPVVLDGPLTEQVDAAVAILCERAPSVRTSGVDWRSRAGRAGRQAVRTRRPRGRAAAQAGQRSRRPPRRSSRSSPSRAGPGSPPSSWRSRCASPGPWVRSWRSCARTGRSHRSTPTGSCACAGSALAEDVGGGGRGTSPTTGRAAAARRPAPRSVARWRDAPQPDGSPAWSATQWRSRCSRAGSSPPSGVLRFARGGHHLSRRHADGHGAPRSPGAVGIGRATADRSLGPCPAGRHPGRVGC